jgi:glycosyltransferase involved in cell wall biosynthesis
MKPPFFSILICSYNRPEYIKEAIASVYNNTFTDFEIILSDDNSNNWAQIEEELHDFKGKSNFKVFNQKTNLSWSDNRNFLVNQASGMYYIIIGDDDKLAKDALEVLHNNIQENPEVEIFAFGYDLIDEKGLKYNTRRGSKYLKFDNNNFEFCKDLLSMDMFPFYLFHPLTLCKKNGSKDLMFNRNAGIGDDLMYLTDAILMNLTILVIPDVLFEWRKVITSNYKKSNVNISYNYKKNLEARLKIVQIVSSKYNKSSCKLTKFVNSIEYRNRFLYEPVLFSHKYYQFIYKSFLKEPYLSEFVLFKNKNLLAISITRRFRIFKKYLKYTGFKGVALIIKGCYKAFVYQFCKL